MDDGYVSEKLAALGNPTRLAVFRVLVRAGVGGVNVGTVQAELDLAPSTLAHHLSTLVRAGLVRQRREGREVFSEADYDALRGALEFVTESCCVGVGAEGKPDAA